jgi:hypothetical protein
MKWNQVTDYDPVPAGCGSAPRLVLSIENSTPFSSLTRRTQIQRRRIIMNEPTDFPLIILAVVAYGMVGVLLALTFLLPVAVAQLTVPTIHDHL